MEPMSGARVQLLTFGHHMSFHRKKLELWTIVFCLSITGILEKLQITVGRTLPVRLPSWFAMSPSLTLQTGRVNHVTLRDKLWSRQAVGMICQYFSELASIVIWSLCCTNSRHFLWSYLKNCDQAIFCLFQFNSNMLILIVQESHWGGVEIHRGRAEGPSVCQDGPNYPQTCCGATRWNRTRTVERWEALWRCVFWWRGIKNRSLALPHASNPFCSVPYMASDHCVSL